MHYQREQFFSSFDEFNSYPHGWDTDFSTTTPEDYSVSLKQSAVPGLLVNTAWLGSPTLQRASTPPGMRTFALPLHLTGPYCWRGLPIDTNTFMAFPTDRELFSLMGADSEVLTISIEQHQVDDMLQVWDVNPEQAFLRPRTTALSNKQRRALRRNLHLVIEFISRYGDHSQFPHLSRGIQEYLLEHMLQPVMGSRAAVRVSPAFAARRVEAAADYILCHLSEPLTVKAVCDNIACSRRSLEQCFMKYAGTSPKQFIQFMRFKRCRAELLAADPGSSVSGIAGRNGFWHMGQFTQTYRRLFGETPGQTLGR